jgi:hypothetical protein
VVLACSGAAPGTLSATPFAPNEQVGKSPAAEMCTERWLKIRKRRAPVQKKSPAVASGLSLGAALLVSETSQRWPRR